MKISELLTFQHELERFNLRRAKHSNAQHLEWVVHTLETSAVVAPELVNQIQNNYNASQASIQEFNNTVQQTIANIKNDIASLQPMYFSKSDELYDEGVRLHEKSAQVLDRRLELDSQKVSILASRIGNQSDWHHAGLLIRPGRESWIDLMVGLDPLYVVDEYWPLLGPLQQRFNQQYLARLRMYVVDTNRTSDLLEDIPDGQIGFCLVYNFFNYRPFGVVKQYLQELYTKLKPGGGVALTYNNCDMPGGARLAENNYASYIPGSMLRSFAESLGYVISYSIDLDQAVTWMELEKPGELTSLRGGQTVAKIVAKP